MSEPLSTPPVEPAAAPVGVVAGPAAPSAGRTSSSSAVVAELTAWVARLGALPDAVDDAERIDRIAVLERLRGAVAAAQARETSGFADSQAAARAAAGLPERLHGRGVAEQVGLARRMSPAAAARQVGFAAALRDEVPAVAELLRRGQISEWVASIVVKETNGLPRPVRRDLTTDLAPDLPRMSPREAEAAARRAAYAADPRAILARARTARSDRRVSVRPAPDTMAILSAFLPAEQGIAAWATLDRHARAVKATGDPRSLGQITADTLVERLTGQPTATAVPVEIGLTMTTDTLLGLDTTTPAHLHGYGPLPAEFALDLAAGAAPTPATDQAGRADRAGPPPDPTRWFPDQATEPRAEQPHAEHAHTEDTRAEDTRAEEHRTDVWIRRLFTDPVTDTVSHVDTGRRRFDGGLARLIRYRDQGCRDPYCDAPIRHLDHIHPHRDGGPTSAANGAGRCERGNYIKDLPGWTQRVIGPSDATARTQDDGDPATADTGAGSADSDHARPNAGHLGNDPATADVARTDTADADPDGRDLVHGPRVDRDDSAATPGRHRIETTTPTGHRYTSEPPPALGPGGNQTELRRRAALRRLAAINRQLQLAAALRLSGPAVRRAATPLRLPPTGQAKRTNPTDPQAQPP